MGGAAGAQAGAPGGSGASLKAARPLTLNVNKLCIFVGMTVAGWAGWALGEAIGFDFMGCFWVSGAGSLVGVWLGWKVARRLE